MLVELAKKQAGKAGKNVARVSDSPITMTLDPATLRGNLTAGKSVKLQTRAARPGDCICSNESAYYPPLARVENFAPGVTLQSKIIQ